MKLVSGLFPLSLLCRRKVSLFNNWENGDKMEIDHFNFSQSSCVTLLYITVMIPITFLLRSALISTFKPVIIRCRATAK